MLLIEQDALDIEGFDTMGRPALTLYLDTDPSRGAGRNVKAQVETMLRPIQASLEGDAAGGQALKVAADLAMTQIVALHPPPRATAVFVCPDLGFIRVLPLREPVGPMAHWGPELQVKPLVAALDEHERTLVVLVDAQRGRAFRVFMGQIEEVASVTGKVEKHGQAGYSQQKFQGGMTGGAIRMGYGEANLQRRHEWHVRQLVDRVLDAVTSGGRLPTDRLLVGGGKEALQELLGLLPKRIRDRTRLVSGIQVDATPAQVLARVLDIQREAEREEEEELLDNLRERDQARSVFGATAVAEAVSDARVHTLVYGADTVMAGGECTRCGWLMPGSAADACPRCGAEVRGIPDLVERMVSSVLHSGGRIEEVRGPALRTLHKSEGLAALLRYVPALDRNSPTRLASTP